MQIRISCLHVPYVIGQTCLSRCYYTSNVTQEPFTLNTWTNRLDLTVHGNIRITRHVWTSRPRSPPHPHHPLRPYKKNLDYIAYEPLFHFLFVNRALPYCLGSRFMVSSILGRFDLSQIAPFDCWSTRTPVIAPLSTQLGTRYFSRLLQFL